MKEGHEEERKTQGLQGERNGLKSQRREEKKIN
jgi:hypothetical protein